MKSSSKISNEVKQILLVEDDPFLIDIYTTKLKEAGFKTEVAENGEIAFKKIRDQNLAIPPKRKKQLWPDLLVLDIVLPKIDGWEILKKIKTDKIFKNLKVIILSNLGQRGEVERGLSLGATKYLIKAHYTPSQVIAEIKEILK